MDENKITAYLNGELSRNEAHDFEAQMQENSVLKEKVQKQEQILKALEYESYHHFLRKVKDFEATLPGISKQVPPPVIVPLVRRLRPMLIAAASIILIIIIVLKYFLPNHEIPNNSKIAQRFYEHPSFIGIASDGSDIANFNSGIAEFDSSHFEKAITYLSNINNQSDIYLRTQYVLAHCYFNLKQYQKAIQHINALKGKEDSLQLFFGNDYQRVDKQEIEWFKVICLLLNKQITDASDMIKMIIKNPDHKYFKQAILLQKEIE